MSSRARMTVGRFDSIANAAPPSRAGGPAYPSTMRALMHVTLPAMGPHSPEFHFAPLIFLLEGMIAVNVWHITQSLKRAELGLGPAIPPLYASGVVYKEDPPGEENWGDVFYCMQMGHADCDRLVIWRCAELRCMGIHAEPVIKWQHLTREQAAQCGYPPSKVSDEGLWMVHCSVRYPDGRVEDVSKNLGMGGNFTGQV